VYGTDSIIALAAQDRYQLQALNGAKNDGNRRYVFDFHSKNLPFL